MLIGAGNGPLEQRWPKVKLQYEHSGSVCLPTTVPFPGAPRWPSGYGVRLESGRSWVRIPLVPGFFFRGRAIPVTSKLALRWLPCQAPGGIGSVLGLVGPVSVYCDWVRWKIGSATSISVWQYVKLSEQIRPWDTLACCWDVKQPTTKKKKKKNFPGSYFQARRVQLEDDGVCQAVPPGHVGRKFLSQQRLAPRWMALAPRQRDILCEARSIYAK